MEEITIAETTEELLCGKGSVHFPCVHTAAKVVSGCLNVVFDKWGMSLNVVWG